MSANTDILIKTIQKVETQNTGRRLGLVTNTDSHHQLELKALKVDYLSRVCRVKLNRCIRSKKISHWRDFYHHLEFLLAENNNGLDKTEPGRTGGAAGSN